MKDFHPVANIFPLIAGDDYAALVADIAEHGQREPIWLHADGSIIDGRNRYRACCDLGLAPKYKTWNGNGSLVAFVVSLNLQRRHLSSSQRAMIALDVLPMLEEEARERQKGGQGGILLDQKIDQASSGRAPQATAQAATITRTNRQYVADAKKIKEEAPDLLEQVRTGRQRLLLERWW